jgi:hypothetical protein
MRRPAALFPILLILGALVLAPAGGARADTREGPIAIDKCQTISQPGSYKLVNNLTFTGTMGGACLVITANFVSIDLAGFNISGSGGDMGIVAEPEPHLTLTGLAVKNGSISDFDVGVDLSSADGSIVQGLRVVGTFPNGGGIGIFAANGIVKGNTVTSYKIGFSVTGTVTGNYVFFNRDQGFSIGQGSTVIGNTVSGLGTTLARVGFSVLCPSNVTDNTALNTTTNLQLTRDGCTNTNNVAP